MGWLVNGIAADAKRAARIGSPVLKCIVILNPNRDRECYFITLVATVVPSV